MSHLELPLRPTGFAQRAMRSGIEFGSIALLAMLIVVVRNDSVEPWWIAITAVGIVWLSIYFARPDPRPVVVRLADDLLVLPRGRYSRRSHRVRCSNLISIERVPGWLMGERLVVLGRDRPLPRTLRASWLAHPGDFEDLWDALRARIRREPGGVERLRGIEVAQQLGRAMRARPTRVVWTAAGALLLFAGLDAWAGAPLGGPWAASRTHLGASEAYRLVTALSLHTNALHFGSNLALLVLAGRFVEGLLGGWRCALLLMASGVAGTLAHALWGHPAPLIGASPAAYGLVGALFLLTTLRRPELPASLHWQPPIWGALLALEIAGIALVATLSDDVRVSAASHAGGFVCGALLTAVAVRGSALASLPRRPGAAWRGATALGLALFVLAFARGLWVWGAR